MKLALWILLVSLTSFITVLTGCERAAPVPVGSSGAAGTGAAGESSPSSRPSATAPAQLVEPGTALEAKDFDRALRDTGAEYIVIQVYMEACGPCMTEALRLTEKLKPWRKAGVAIMGMGMDETAAGPRAFFENTGRRIAYPLYLAPWFAEQQEVLTTPTLFIYAADGKQLFRTDPERAAEGVMIALERELSRLVGKSLASPAS